VNESVVIRRNNREIVMPTEEY